MFTEKALGKKALAGRPAVYLHAKVVCGGIDALLQGHCGNADLALLVHNAFLPPCSGIVIIVGFVIPFRHVMLRRLQVRRTRDVLDHCLTTSHGNTLLFALRCEALRGVARRCVAWRGGAALKPKVLPCDFSDNKASVDATLFRAKSPDANDHPCSTQMRLEDFLRDDVVGDSELRRT